MNDYVARVHIVRRHWLAEEESVCPRYEILLDSLKGVDLSEDSPLCRMGSSRDYPVEINGEFVPAIGEISGYLVPQPVSAERAIDVGIGVNQAQVCVCIL